MKKIIILLAFINTIFADPRPSQEDFAACYQKNKDSLVSINGKIGLAIGKNLIALPNQDDLVLEDYIKFDPYLGLYLIHSDKDLKPIQMLDEIKDLKKSSWVGILSDDNKSKIGNIKSFSTDLGEFDALNFKNDKTGILNDGCCKLVGLAIGSDKFIPNRYLKHFAAYDDVYYGDTGTKFEQKNDKFYVKIQDPLSRGYKLKAGDLLISINNKKPKNLRELNEMILFAPKGSKLNFTVKREYKILNLEIPVSGETKIDINKEIDRNIKNNIHTNIKREENKDISDFGLEFDDKLMVNNVKPNSKAKDFGINTGDKLITINKEKPIDYKDFIKKADKSNTIMLLLNRDGFDFFVNIKK